jgi:hypothetical protein
MATLEPTNYNSGPAERANLDAQLALNCDMHHSRWQERVITHVNPADDQR